MLLNSVPPVCKNQRTNLDDFEFYSFKVVIEFYTERRKFDFTTRERRIKEYRTSSTGKNLIRESLGFETSRKVLFLLSLTVSLWNLEIKTFYYNIFSDCHTKTFVRSGELWRNFVSVFKKLCFLFLLRKRPDSYRSLISRRLLKY